MNLSVPRGGSVSPSRPASGAAPWQIGPRHSQDAPHLRREQLAADAVEVRQREEAEGPREVLGEAAIPDLGKSPQALHDVERMLATGPGPRPGPINRPPPRGERALDRKSTRLNSSHRP